LIFYIKINIIRIHDFRLDEEFWGETLSQATKESKRAHTEKTGGKRLLEDSRAKQAKKTGIIPFLVIGAAILALAVCLLWSMFKYDGIYPNVKFAGINIGGMSMDEARTAIESVLATYADDKIEVSYDDVNNSISVLDAGAVMSASEAFDAAYSIGREGSFFEKAWMVISSVFTSRDVLADTEINIDAIMQFLGYFEKVIDQKKYEPDYIVYDDYIELDTGKNGQKLDTEKAAQAIADKIRTGDMSPVSLKDFIINDNAKKINLLDIYNEVCKEAADASLDISGEEPKIVPHVTGISFDIARAEAMLKDAAATGKKVVVPLIRTEPEITTEEFESLLFRDVLSEAKTTLNASNLNRTGNVRLSANAINGKILNPGDVFSYNETVGERTYANGYKDASVYTSSGIEDQLGGGICQTSSTLYMNVIRVGLEIIERYNHSYTVVYAPLGEDATVYWGSLDFKFSNNLRFPIKIEAYQEKDYVVVRILGTKENNNRVEIETKTLSYTPYNTITVMNPDLDYGVKRQKTEGHSAYSVETYRVVYDENGKEISREKLPSSRYKRLDRVIEIGTKGAPSETVSPIETVSPSETPPGTPSVSPTSSPTPSDQPSHSPDPSPSPAEPSHSPSDPSPAGPDDDSTDAG